MHLRHFLDAFDLPERVFLLPISLRPTFWQTGLMSCTDTVHLAKNDPIV
jgi:hypothetical protein